ncbi:MAG: hypothetical protein LBU39_06575 [Desulfobulbaceae bacterium]|jgi:plasmid stability protein|nr:hypothetical protein [Desulfobulbaceae bacterium]
MPATLTLKNIPDTLHARLKAAAKANRRSLNNEAIVCLETALMPQNNSVSKHFDAARMLRARFQDKMFSPDVIDALKGEGRP